VAVADLQEAEVELTDAERGLEINVDDLAAARAQQDLRSGALERQRSLASRGVGTEAAVEAAALAEASALQAVLSKRQNLATATSRVDQARNGVLRAQIELANAQRTLDDTAVIASFDGTLASVTGQLGTILTSNEQVGSLIDPSDLEVSFRVSTQQYARMVSGSGGLPGLPVTVSLDADGVDLTASGIISRESAAVESGQSGRLLFARLNASPGLRSGDFVTVKIEELLLDNVALLPSSAVDASGTVLVIAAENRLEVANAPILRRQGDMVIVDASEVAGLRLVSERSPLLGAGIRVSVNGETAPPNGERSAQRGSGGGRGEGAQNGEVAERPQGAERPTSGTPETARGAEQASDMIELSKERRETLLSFVKSNSRMPDEARSRILAQLNEKQVSLTVIERLESRMGN
jgi:multidrug efflux pump subunit AcrA (membrane-fusion protein)